MAFTLGFSDQTGIQCKITNQEIPLRLGWLILQIDPYPAVRILTPLLQEFLATDLA